MCSLQLLRLFAQHIGSTGSRFLLKFFDSFTIVHNECKSFSHSPPQPTLIPDKTHLSNTPLSYFCGFPCLWPTEFNWNFLHVHGRKGFPRMGTVYLWLQHWRNCPASHPQQPLTANSFGAGGRKEESREYLPCQWKNTAGPKLVLECSWIILKGLKFAISCWSQSISCLYCPTYLHVLPAEEFVPSMQGFRTFPLPLKTVCCEISGDHTPNSEGHFLASMYEQH